MSETVFTSLLGAKVSEVLASGFIDRDHVWPRFVPLAGVWYLVLDDDLVELAPVSTEGQLTVRRVAAPTPPAQLDGEDEEFALASVGELFFDTAGPELPITRIRCLADERSDPGAGVFRYVEFELWGRIWIGFDPWNHFGIRPVQHGAYQQILAGGPATGTVRPAGVWPAPT